MVSANAPLYAGVSKCLLGTTLKSTDAVTPVLPIHQQRQAGRAPIHQQRRAHKHVGRKSMCAKRSHLMMLSRMHNCRIRCSPGHERVQVFDNILCMQQLFAAQAQELAVLTTAPAICKQVSEVQTCRRARCDRCQLNLPTNTVHNKLSK